MATEVEICNLALIRLGVGFTLTSSDDTVANMVASAHATVPPLKNLYPRRRRQLLRAAPWPFATYSTLLALAADQDHPWANQYGYAYTYPALALHLWAWTLERGVSVGYPTSIFSVEQRLGLPARLRPWRFKIVSWDGAKTVLGNIEPDCAFMDITEDIDDAARFDDDFESVLAWDLAAELLPYVRSEQGRTLEVKREAAIARAEAIALHLNEPEDDDDRDTSFVDVRGGG